MLQGYRLIVHLLVYQKLVDEKKKVILAAHANGLEKKEDIGTDLLSHLSEFISLASCPEAIELS